MAALPGLANFLGERSGSPVLDGGDRPFGSRIDLAGFARAAGWFGGLLLAASGLMMASRRIVGAFVVPPGGWEFAAAIGGGAMALLVTEAACRLGATPTATALARTGFAAAILALGLPDDRMSWTSSPLPIASVAAASLALIAPLLLVAHPTGRRPRPERSLHPAPGRPRRRRSRTAGSRPPGRLSQWQERYRLDSGDDWIRGRIQLEVPAGARSAQGHLGFCPAFTEMPEVRVETPYDGVEATVSAAEVVPWGVRIECRLAEPAEETIEIPVDVLAKARS